MPNIFIGSFKAAKANRDSKQALAPPHVAGGDCAFSQLQGLGGINQHFDWFLYTGFEQVLQGVIVLVLWNWETMVKMRKP